MRQTTSQMDLCFVNWMLVQRSCIGQSVFSYPLDNMCDQRMRRRGEKKPLLIIHLYFKRKIKSNYKWAWKPLKCIKVSGYDCNRSLCQLPCKELSLFRQFFCFLVLTCWCARKCSRWILTLKNLLNTGHSFHCFKFFRWLFRYKIHFAVNLWLNRNKLSDKSGTDTVLHM